MLRDLRRRVLAPLRSPLRAPAGRVLAVKWGYNPNSSSLGVDVTFLLFGMAAISMATPFVSLLLSSRRAAPATATRGSSGAPPGDA